MKVSTGVLTYAYPCTPEQARIFLKITCIHLCSSISVYCSFTQVHSRCDCDRKEEWRVQAELLVISQGKQ